MEQSGNVARFEKGTSVPSRVNLPDSLRLSVELLPFAGGKIGGVQHRHGRQRLKPTLLLCKLHK